VGCSHHQAIDKVGQGFKVTGQCHQGISHSMEFCLYLIILESQERWILAVQFHPERVSNNRIFTDSFIQKCKEYKSSQEKYI
jgi:gamma-glutamyl-gamma-aminobutyrate hydrolase PuuD